VKSWPWWLDSTETVSGKPGAIQSASWLTVCIRIVENNPEHSTPFVKLADLVQIHWEGNSQDELAGFPEEIRADLGFALFEMQQGKKPSSPARRMESIGPNVTNLRKVMKRPDSG
jgi:hypothetical protein